MEAYLRLILLGAAFVIVLFVVVEAVMTRRRKYKLANLSENFTSPIQIDNDDELDLDGKEPQIRGEDDGHDYYLAERAPRQTEADTYADDAEARDIEEVMVVTRPEKTTRPAAPALDKDASAREYANDLLVLTVAAKPGQQFGSYDLLQSIYATGMEFGDMNIFHYYASDEQPGKVRLFSLASATEPGEFDLDRIGNYFCGGLTLFSQLDQVPDPRQAFNLMLKAAEQLAEDLNGELRAGPRRVWDDNVLREYQQKTLYFYKHKMNA
jgi:cell division protein ZipA